MKPIDKVVPGGLRISQIGSLAVGEIILPETSEVIISRYSVWKRPATEGKIRETQNPIICEFRQLTISDC
jgi:hypothetical protein